MKYTSTLIALIEALYECSELPGPDCRTFTATPTKIAGTLRFTLYDAIIVRWHASDFSVLPAATPYVATTPGVSGTSSPASPLGLSTLYARRTSTALPMLGVYYIA